MYEAVHPAPHGDSTVARHAVTAAEAGFDGVVVRGRPGDDADVAAVRDDVDADVATGAEIVVDDPSVARGHVGNLRPSVTVLLVRGGSSAMNRFAVETPRVDVLTAPMTDGGDFNHVLANAAADNDVAVEFDFGPVLRRDGGPRVRALQRLRKLRELVVDADAPFVVSAGPRSHLHQRAPRELVAVGEVVGFDAADVRAGLDAWGDLVSRNRHRQSDAFVAPGVEVDREGKR
ncbi:MAG: RNase P subunit p30 family protein [Halobacteriaceae archaeon]